MHDVKHVWSFDKTIDNLQDWDKKYSNTFVSFDGVPAHVSITSASTCIGDAVFGGHVMHNPAKYEIKPYFPKNQWIEYNGNYSFLRRVPERQYQRSCNANCYSIDFPHLNIFSGSLNMKQAVKAVQQTVFSSFNTLINKDNCTGILNADFSMFKTGKNTFSIVGCNGVIAISREDKREVWTFNHTLDIVRDIIGATEEWQINCLDVSIT